MIVQTGAGGWALFLYGVDDEDELVRVRFAVRADGRLEPAEVHLEGHSRLTGETLRNVPLGSMEAWANGGGREELVERIRDAGSEIDQATDTWLTTVGGGHRGMWGRFGFPLDQVRRQALRLRIPDGPKRPDSFYKRVGEMYSTLAASGSRRPASEIAEANGLPVTTVHRWIKEARVRKVLTSGRRGRAG